MRATIREASSRISFWRSVKYEEIYLRPYTNGTDARMALSRYFRIYNVHRPHSSLGHLSPNEFLRRSKTGTEKAEFFQQ
jgi:putative transposase